MTVLDVKDAMFHLASTPHRSMDQYTVIVFDSGDSDPPSFDDVAAHIDHRARRVPRLGIRICEAPGQWEFPRWVRDPHPVRDHLVDHDLSNGRHTLDSFLAELSSVPVDATDRAWKIHVGRGLSEVDGARGAATVVVVQISHALSDGSVGTHIARGLFGRDDITGHTTLTDPVASRARPRYDAVKAAVLLPFRWARSQIPMVRAQRKYLAAVRDGELVTHAPVEGVTFNAHPDETRVVHLMQFPKSHWTGGSATVTVTALTAVGAALAEYFAAHGEPDRDDLRALVPTALPASVPWPAVNRTLPAAVELHPQLADVTRRAKAVGESLALQRVHVTDHRHLDATRSAEVYPAALVLGFGRHGRRAAPRTGTPDRVNTHTVVTSINRTNLELMLGSARALSCAGMAALGPGCSVSHAVYGYGDLITVCVTACPTTVPDHADYATMLRSAIEETCAALHGTATTEVRR
ncbi:hypothetical protein ASG84_22505 [Rhodococcus sp. Leaf278]|uniref:wax ester/triacylglycerol synthase domain-containing protein n=1 Tax=Rhodococcus sp. Leaf278 TaxID=1736319 RepID=UPI00070BBCEE|nr:wax ester/triacylglycerol synthase domain-containing protein [Rhodococcus sp. Leaf278]KQU55213.1 hypothetical protein ASG84_22505 [Rhodococcus sp. Leaf278]